MAFALSRPFVIGLSFTLRVGMPKCSRLFALMNDRSRFGFVYIGFVGSCQCCSSLSSKFPKLFPTFVQSSLFSFVFLLIRVISMEGGILPWCCSAGWCCSSV